MKREELIDLGDGYDSYLELLCKAILLDKVKIDNGKIKVQSWEE